MPVSVSQAGSLGVRAQPDECQIGNATRWQRPSGPRAKRPLCLLPRAPDVFPVTYAGGSRCRATAPPCRCTGRCLRHSASESDQRLKIRVHRRKAR